MDILRFVLAFEVIVHVGCVDLQFKGWHVLVARIEEDIFKQLLKDGVQAAGADVLGVLVGVAGGFGDGGDRAVQRALPL